MVIGFGGAGACAAIEAAGSGARVLVVERFGGGGATKKSGGVIYAGGGTAVQRAAGFRDTNEKMYRYLARETGANGKTLRAFCAASVGSLEWLQRLGIRIPEKYYDSKTTQPPGGYGLYYSGNEKQYTGDDPVPRGHVPDGTGMSGGSLYRALSREALKRGATVRYRCRPRSLIIESGAVAGIELLTLSNNPRVRLLHALLFNFGYASGICRRSSGTARGSIQHRYPRPCPWRRGDLRGRLRIQPADDGVARARVRRMHAAGNAR